MNSSLLHNINSGGQHSSAPRIPIKGKVQVAGKRQAAGVPPHVRMDWNSVALIVTILRCSLWSCEKLQSSVTPLLASPQGGVAERSRKYREASADREDGVVFR